MINLKDKIVLITGASSGIGQACSRLLAQQGARLILCARRLERLKQLEQDLLQSFGTLCLTLQLDVQSKAQVQHSLGSLPAEWENIEVLINNAGLALKSTPLQEGAIEDWETMIDTNLKGLLYMTKAILPGMLSREKGHVVNIGSIAGRETYPNGNVYCATKFAVRALSQSLRFDLLGTPIRVTEIAPGAVETEFSEVRWNDKEKARAFYQDFNPLYAEDIADAVHYCITRPKHVDIAEMLIMPTAQAAAGYISRTGKKLQ